MSSKSFLPDLTFLLRADSALIAGDVNRARHILRANGEQMRRDMGVSMDGVAASVKSAGERLKGLPAASAAAMQGLTLLGGRGSSAAAALTLALGNLAAGGFTPLSATIAASTTALGWWGSAAGKANEAAAAALEEHARAVDKHLGVVRALAAERFDFDNGTNLAPLAAAMNDVAAAADRVRAQEGRVAAARADNVLGIDLLTESAALSKANDELIAAVDRRTRILQAAELAQRTAAREFDKALDAFASARANEEFLRGFTGATRQAELEIQALERNLRDLAGKIGLSPDQARSAVGAGYLDEQSAARMVAGRADAERRVTIEIEKQAEAARARALAEDVRPYRERFESARATLAVLRAGRDPLDAQARAQREISQLVQAELGLQGRSLDIARQRTAEARQAADAERDLEAALRRQEAVRDAIQSAADMERQNRMDASRNDPSKTDLQRDIDAWGVEFGRAIMDMNAKGLLAGDPARTALVDQWMERKRQIYLRYARTEHDERAAAARDTARDVAAAETQLAFDVAQLTRSETERRVAEAEARYSTLIARAREFGVSTVALERELATVVGNIRREGEMGLHPETGPTAQTRAAVLDAEEDLAFDLAQLDRDETERRVAEFRRQAEALLEEARKRGVSTVKLEELIAERVRRIREEGSESPLQKGFRETLTNMGDMQSLQTELGETAASGLAGGLSDLFVSISTGSKTASADFRKFASDFLMGLSRMVAQAVIARAILSAFGMGTTAAGGGGDGGGGGGLAVADVANPSDAAGSGYWASGAGKRAMSAVAKESRAMKFAPYSGGATATALAGAPRQKGGDDAPHVTVTVQPTPVLADEVERKMRPDAKARIVATATSRPGRRGSRARWD